MHSISTANFHQMRKNLLLLFLPVLLLGHCMPVQEENLTEINYDLKDELLQKMLNFRDQRQTDSLVVFFQHKDPTYRYAAALAMGSVQDQLALEGLTKLLDDKVERVRSAAAFAIGQIGDASSEQALISAFGMEDSLGKSDLFYKTVLEAVGKSASPQYLTLLSTVKSYLRTDTALLMGQTLGIYRYGLRGIIQPEGTERMMEILVEPGYPDEVRLVAANYLARFPQVRLDSLSLPLIKAYDNTNDSETRMALALALGKSREAAGRQTLITAFRNERDYRVRCNILRALANFREPEVQQLVMEAVKDPNPNVAAAAVQHLLGVGLPAKAVEIWQLAKDTSLHWSLQMALYRAANKHLPPYFEGTKGRINQELRRRFAESNNTYEKGQALVGLSEFGWNYRYIREQGLSSTVPVIRTASAEAMANIARYPEFEKAFGLGHRRAKRELAAYFVDAIRSGDIGMMAIAAGVIGDPQLDYRSVIDSTQFLEAALSNLKLPQEMETAYALQQAIDYFNGRPARELERPTYNHPIDWFNVNEVSDKTRAVIRTNRGNITLRFFKDEAPASVANFLQLAKNGFYDGKRFHRVVPNFVVQAGCPRGDGYGSLNYSIRSEFDMRYYNRGGYVGMASAGPDTECTQWFITHSPTMHLDGRYTIFAEVVDGMDAVDQLQVGDSIDKIFISK